MMVGKLSKSSPVLTRLGLHNRQSYSPVAIFVSSHSSRCSGLTAWLLRINGVKPFFMSFSSKVGNKSLVPVCSRKTATLRPCLRSFSSIFNKRSSLGSRSISRPGAEAISSSLSFFSRVIRSGFLQPSGYASKD